MEFKNKKILVVGFGKSGLATARCLIKRGANVTIGDIKPESALDTDILKEVRGSGIKLEIGGHNTSTFLSADMIIVSPGVPLNIKPLAAAREKGIPISGEFEMASRLVDSPILAVTGTNGKTTTVSLIEEIIKRSGRSLFAGGNIGVPLMEYVSEGVKSDFVLVEVSSFQLDTAERFNPFVSLILNITPDHLDRYESFDAYARSKQSITKNQGKGQYAILNDDDPLLHDFKPGNDVTVLRYGLKRSDRSNAYIEENMLIASIPGKSEASFSLDGFKLPGAHNLSNLMGVVLVALCAGIDKECIQETILEFKGLHHRIEHVAELSGVDFYDDSKATNVDAAIKSIEVFDRPIILIAGGVHKGGEYEPLVIASKRRVKRGVFLGEARFMLGDAFKGKIPYEYAEDMGAAAKKAFGAAVKGDVVLLAPACSSFDMFTDYSHRGMVFREKVEELKNE
jgi:UDP-N-acetylmuramoylalanine--D-glutamate ligase